MTSRPPRRGSFRAFSFPSLLALACLLLNASTTSSRACADSLRTPANELIVELTPGVASTALVSVVNGLHWHVVTTTKEIGELPEDAAEVLRIAPNTVLPATLSGAISALVALTGVRTVEQNIPFGVTGTYGGEQSEVPVYLDDLVLADMSAQSAFLDAGLGAPSGPSGNPAVRVAVLDGGFDLGVETLYGRCASAYDPIDHDADPSDDGNQVDDDGDGRTDGGVGHGTAVASLIAVAAPEAVIVPIRVLDDEGRGTTYDLVYGISHARAAGVALINLSLGSPASSQIVENALTAAKNHGVLVVASAGNTGNDGPTYPATSSNVIAVTGVTSAGLRAPQASIGPCVDAAAQSVSVIAPFPGLSNGYGAWSGTSFSAATFSAAVARVLQQDLGSALDAGAAVLAALAAFPSAAAPESGAMGGGILDASTLLDD